MWRIDDLSHPPKSAFTFNDFVLDWENADPSMVLPQFSASAFYDGAYPIDLDQDQRTIWLSYCATGFLKTHDSKPVILPDADARFDVRIYGCTAQVEWRSANDMSPSKVDFVFSRKLMSSVENNLSYQTSGDFLEQRAKMLAQYLSWATNGMLRARFAVSDWTNFMGRGIPLNWSIQYFTQGRLARIFEGQTESVNVQLVPSPPSRLLSPH